MDPIFKHAQYETHRPRFQTAYADQMVDYLSLKNPGATRESLEQFVKGVIKDRIQIPTARIVRHPTPGNTVKEEVPLSTHIQKNISQNIITPSGTVYCTPDVRESFLKKSISTKLSLRKKYKKEMLKARGAGDNLTADIYHYLQSQTKIFVNSAPGAMNSPFNILYDLPGYNAITSGARHSVKYGYASVERMVAGNIYLTSYDDVITYCLRLRKVCPKGFAQELSSRGLNLISPEQTADYLLRNYKMYTLTPETEDIQAFVQTLTVEECSFIFYAGSLYNLVTANGDYFKAFFNDFFRTDMPIDPSDNPEDIFKLTNGDMLAMITSLNDDFLGVDKKGRVLSVGDACKVAPDGVRKLIAIARHMCFCLESLRGILSAIFRLGTDMTRINDHPNMVRRCVMVSDTDSVIFTTQPIIDWHSGKITFSKRDYELNAFTVFCVSQTLEHVFARLSCGFGMTGDDIYHICMKNEFLYPIMMATSIKKHYAGIILIQEGTRLFKPKTDIKGLGFKTSTRTKEANTETENLLVDTFNEIIQKGTIKARDVLGRVSSYEFKIYESLRRGEKTYLQTASVNDASEYKDEDKSNYFYYKLWESVFVPKYDSVILPNKMLKVPLINGGKILHDPVFQENLKTSEPEIYDKLYRFLADWKTKSISQILMPVSLKEIPEYLRDAVDIRSVIYQNCSGMYLGLSSMGFAYGWTKESLLVSDFFRPKGAPQISLG